MKMISEHSAGGAVFKIANSSPQTVHRKNQSAVSRKPLAVSWLLSKHSGYHKWVLPKGIIEQDETPEQAALREVREETGITAKIIKKITPEVSYKYKKGDTLVDKKVTFFLMEYTNGDVKDHSWEMEDAKWVTSNEAQKLLAFDTEKQALKSAINLIK